MGVPSYLVEAPEREERVMAVVGPVAELDARFSSGGAKPTEWSDARSRLAAAEVYWLSTVRTDGRPHVTPLLAIWQDDAAYFCTGPRERKAENLELNPHCILTTGCNTLGEGLDLVIEGDAVRVTDRPTLQRLVDAYESKYGPDWRFDVADGGFAHPGSSGLSDEARAEVVLVFRVAPSTVFAFGKGDVYSQTRWRFGPD
jgi:general stress protein 26